MIDSLIDCCLEAGSVILQFFRKDKFLFYTTKQDTSPVTSADFFSNKIIISHLQYLTPEIPVVSEENFLFSEIYNNMVDCFWVVDPLDGTKEFLLRSCEFTINIALVEHGIPIIGVVYAPAMGILYASSYNKAWKVDIKTGSRVRISVQRSYPPVIVVSRFHNDYISMNQYLEYLKRYTVITVGSSLKFCLIAEGIAQIYPRFSCTNIWDTAAGHAIAMAAGAEVTDWNGYPLRYVLRMSCLNPYFRVFVP